MKIFKNRIIFLDNIPHNINVNKTNKSFYFKSFMIKHETISRFIYELPENEIFLINPFISRYDMSNDPYLVLSKHFFITNETNPKLITNYLKQQLDKAENDFGLQFFENSYHLILKCKPITFNEKNN